MFRESQIELVPIYVRDATGCVGEWVDDGTGFRDGFRYGTAGSLDEW